MSKEDEVLLKEIVKVLSPGMLRRGDAIAGEGELVESDDYLFINKKYKGILAKQILTKAREAVGGAGLTDEETADAYRQIWYEGKQDSLPTISVRRAIANVQLQAILRALGGE